MKASTAPLSGSWVYRWLLTVADTWCDKCTLIYRGDKAVLCEPGTLKTGVTVIWTHAKIYVRVLKRASGSGVCFVKAFGWGSKMLGSVSNAVSPTDNRDRFLMRLPVCCYWKIHVRICSQKYCLQKKNNKKYKCKWFIIWIAINLTYGV